MVIAGEPRGHNVYRILEVLRAAHGEIELGLSVVTIVELTHGIERAKDDERRRRRQAFVDEVVRDLPIYPVNVEIARLAGRIEGEQAGRGIRHFEAIPGLTVVKT